MTVTCTILRGDCVKAFLSILQVSGEMFGMWNTGRTFRSQEIVLWARWVVSLCHCVTVWSDWLTLSVQSSPATTWAGAPPAHHLSVPPQPPPRSRGLAMPQPHYDPLSSPPMSGRSTPKVSSPLSLHTRPFLEFNLISPLRVFYCFGLGCCLIYNTIKLDLSPPFLSHFCFPALF